MRENNRRCKWNNSSYQHYQCSDWVEFVLFFEYGISERFNGVYGKNGHHSCRSYIWASGILCNAVQPSPDGLAQAFIIGADFIGNDSVAMVLGDNIFAGHGLKKRLNAAVEKAENGKGATVFGYYVDDPERFGIVEFDKNLKPSARGELEITDLNRMYLEDGTLNVELLGQGFTWLDTGTHESLVNATNFVKTVEQHQHRKIACLEEIAYLNGWISKDELMEVYEVMKKNQYGQYLKDVMDGKYQEHLY